MNKKKKRVIITLCIVLFLGLVSYGAYTVFVGGGFNNGNNSSQNPNDPFASLPNATKRTTILLVGVDERKGDAGRTDTILLATIDPQRNKISFISIPRDTRVLVPGRRYYSKINAAYAYGGIQKTRETIENLLGIKIDYYIKTNFNGFVQVIDILGGVELNVEKRMKYTDRAGGLYIDLQPGLQRLDGQKAIQYVRFRHDANGSDTARIARQQKFMQAVTEQCLKPATILKIPQLLKQVSENVETDMSTVKVIQLARFAKQIGREGIQTPLILPGEAKYVGRVSYYLPDYEKSQILLADLVYGEKLSEADKKILLDRKKYIDSLNNVDTQTEVKPSVKTTKYQQQTQATTTQPIQPVQPSVIKTPGDEIPYENTPDEEQTTTTPPQTTQTTTQLTNDTQTPQVQVPTTPNNTQSTTTKQQNTQTNKPPVQQEETQQNNEPTSTPVKTTTQPTTDNTNSQQTPSTTPNTQVPPMQ